MPVAVGTGQRVNHRVSGYGGATGDVLMAGLRESAGGARAVCHMVGTAVREKGVREGVSDNRRSGTGASSRWTPSCSNRLTD
ncbi:hypothetical protein Kpho01_16610 [Kitasatospora phosalacinea]|uniref:Uncharacterized protein n=1 Tax=Kitasatospora phosalacinea TaxID=2065 RepID=A0A9W6PEL2_9ACTN|nr:hypothetical protein Kpho01_16610 [Kitasatospora phosalacinea]